MSEKPKRVMITDNSGVEWMRLDIFPERELVWVYLVPPDHLRIADELLEMMTKTEAIALASALADNWE